MGRVSKKPRQILSGNSNTPPVKSNAMLSRNEGLVSRGVSLVKGVRGLVSKFLGFNVSSIRTKLHSVLNRVGSEAHMQKPKVNETRNLLRKYIREETPLKTISTVQSGSVADESIIRRTRLGWAVYAVSCGIPKGIFTGVKFGGKFIYKSLPWTIVSKFLYLSNITVLMTHGLKITGAIGLTVSKDVQAKMELRKKYLALSRQLASQDLIGGYLQQRSIALQSLASKKKMKIKNQPSWRRCQDKMERIQIAIQKDVNANPAEYAVVFPEGLDKARSWDLSTVNAKLRTVNTAKAQTKSELKSRELYYSLLDQDLSNSMSKSVRNCNIASNVGYALYPVIDSLHNKLTDWSNEGMLVQLGRYVQWISAILGVPVSMYQMHSAWREARLLKNHELQLAKVLESYTRESSENNNEIASKQIQYAALTRLVAGKQQSWKKYAESAGGFLGLASFVTFALGQCYTSIPVIPSLTIPGLQSGIRLSIQLASALIRNPMVLGAAGVASVAAMGYGYYKANCYRQQQQRVEIAKGILNNMRCFYGAVSGVADLTEEQVVARDNLRIYFAEHFPAGLITKIGNDLATRALVMEQLESFVLENDPAYALDFLLSEVQSQDRHALIEFLSNTGLLNQKQLAVLINCNTSDVVQIKAFFSNVLRFGIEYQV